MTKEFTRGERIHITGGVEEMCDRMYRGDLTAMTQEYKDKQLNAQMGYLTKALSKFKITQRVYDEVIEDALQTLDYYNIPRAIINNQQNLNTTIMATTARTEQCDEQCEENVMSYREQCNADRSDYINERLERGEIDEENAAELRMGA